MEIEVKEGAPRFELKLKGRLDAGWSAHLSAHLAACIKEGRHEISVDLSGVSYISSAGIRVLVDFYKQLRGINGTFGISRASDQVRSVLSQAGLFKMLSLPKSSSCDGVPQTQQRESNFDANGFRSDVYVLGPGDFGVEYIGDPAAFRAGPGRRIEVSFAAGTIGLGLGAFTEGSSPPPGEFLAVEGMAACRPGDGSNQADYLLTQENLIPTLSAMYALKAEGAFSHLFRFETSAREHAVPLSRLAGHVLRTLSCNEAVCVVAAETRAVVGAALVNGGTWPLFDYPGIKERITFTSEPAYRDTLTVAVGFLKQGETSQDSAFLRPLSRNGNLLGHFHAIVFPFSPLRKGKIELRPLLSSLFEDYPSLALLHLLNDWRETSGAGESDFLRGAVWSAPVSNTRQRSTQP